jgi:hypothetical protein
VGGILLPGSPAVIRSCSTMPSQRWTLAADGTLRASGLCAEPDGGNVHLVTCDTGQSGQWRVGAGKTLVNISTYQCLTDADNGAKTGNRAKMSDCGGTGQSWNVP